MTRMLPRVDGYTLFVACKPGLEELLAAELSELGVTVGSPTAGGVELVGDAASVMRINLSSGIATHVLLRVGEVEARHFSALVKRAKRLPWSELLPAATHRTVRATCKRSKLYHSGAVAQRIEQAVDEALGSPGDSDGPAVELVARMDRDRCTISIDTSGEALHRRGWRKQTAKAPLREDLAHALLLASGWDRESVLVDPLCGSGTIAIEAVGLARRLAPGRLRGFAFEHTRLMDQASWSAIVKEAEARARPLPASILARDRNAGALEATRGNAKRAGVDDDLQIVEADLEHEALPTGAALVTNPPYGQRIRGPRPVQQHLGARITEAEISRVAVVAPTEDPCRLPGVPLHKMLMTDHGGTKVAFFVANQGVQSSGS